MIGTPWVVGRGGGHEGKKKCRLGHKTKEKHTKTVCRVQPQQRAAPARRAGLQAGASLPRRGDERTGAVREGAAEKNEAVPVPDRTRASASNEDTLGNERGKGSKGTSQWLRTLGTMAASALKASGCGGGTQRR